MKDLINNVERMTSIEIAEVTGKQHNNVLKAIRKWRQHGRKLLRENFTSVHTRTLLVVHYLATH